MSNQLPPEPDVCQDLGKLLKQTPHLFIVQKIVSAEMPDFLKELELMVILTRRGAPSGQSIRFVKIKCINAVDYALRPKDPAILEGGRFMEYFEEHPLLTENLQYVPHTDDGEKFNPPIKFTLLQLDDTYVIAERFDMLTIHSPSSA